MRRAVGIDALPDNGIVVYCDGSGDADPRSPACIGVAAYVRRMPVAEVSAVCGLGTNNVAELHALMRAAEVALYLHRQEPLPMRVLSDSMYAIGIATNPRWSPRRNVELAEEARRVLLPALALGLRVEHVQGHASIWGNCMADYLAGRARDRYLGRQERRAPAFHSVVQRRAKRGIPTG